MAQHVNQHFVPQFYFRRFSGGGNAINLLLTKDGTVVRNASIKHQCAAHRFYGPTDFEALITALEGDHSTALRVTAEAARSGDWSAFTEQTLASLWQAVVFQRSRTALEMAKSKNVPDAIAKPAFRAYLANTPGIEDRDRIIEAIDKGEFEVVQAREAALAQSMSIALDGALLISDLDFCVLRNCTDYPFIFSDSPVVFYNTMMRNVTSRGVLGLRSPGLQIFFPLDSELLLMMYDGGAYPISHDNHLDLMKRSDVSQLNALQIHHSLSAVYFGPSASQEYVESLWHAHGRRLRPPQVELRTLTRVMIDGKSESGEMLQIFEPHLSIRLDLSFIKCEAVADHDYRFRRRSPELVAEYRKMRDSGEAERRGTQPDE